MRTGYHTGYHYTPARNLDGHKRALERLRADPAPVEPSHSIAVARTEELIDRLIKLSSGYDGCKCSRCRGTQK